MPLGPAWLPFLGAPLPLLSPLLSPPLSPFPRLPCRSSRRSASLALQPSSFPVASLPRARPGVPGSQRPAAVTAATRPGPAAARAVSAQPQRPRGAGSPESGPSSPEPDRWLGADPTRPPAAPSQVRAAPGRGAKLFPVWKRGRAKAPG